ncbi:hypothetical protein GGF31_001875 [Allomyces arbusculus]|nr:hypothetical protein GGF31_001875 [Allomyces arbusculus]
MMMRVPTLPRPRRTTVTAWLLVVLLVLDARAALTLAAADSDAVSAPASLAGSSPLRLSPPGVPTLPLPNPPVNGTRPSQPARFEQGWAFGVEGRPCLGYSLAESRYCPGFASVFLGPTNIVPGLLFLLNKPENSAADASPLIAAGFANLTSAADFDAAFESVAIVNAPHIASRWTACTYANHGLRGFITYACQWLVNYGFLRPAGNVWFQETCTVKSVSAVPGRVVAANGTASPRNGPALPVPPGLCGAATEEMLKSAVDLFEVDPSCDPAVRKERDARLDEYRRRSAGVTNRNDTSVACISRERNEGARRMCGFLTPTMACLNNCTEVPNCATVLKDVKLVTFQGTTISPPSPTSTPSPRSNDASTARTGSASSGLSISAKSGLIVLSVLVLLLSAVGIGMFVRARRRRRRLLGAARTSQFAGPLGGKPMRVTIAPDIAIPKLGPQPPLSRRAAPDLGDWPLPAVPSPPPTPKKSGDWPLPAVPSPPPTPAKPGDNWPVPAAVPASSPPAVGPGVRPPRPASMTSLGLPTAAPPPPIVTTARVSSIVTASSFDAHRWTASSPLDLGMDLGMQRLARSRVALYAFIPQRDDEMALQIGDMVVVEVEFDDGWGHGVRLDPVGEVIAQGAVPLNCFEVMSTTVGRMQESAKSED